MLTLPKNRTLIEHPIATFWFDENGILHSVSKQGPRTIEVMDEYIAFVKDLVNGERVCILTDISKASPMDKETRDYTATQLQHVYKAMAILSKTPVGNTIGKLFLQLDGQPYPTGMFANEKDAKNWLRQYL